jgi:hypothetical protein
MQNNHKLFTYICTQWLHSLRLHPTAGLCQVAVCFGVCLLAFTTILFAQTRPTSESNLEAVAENPVTRQLIVVTGAPGEEAYTGNFRNWSERWVQASQAGNIECEWIDGTQPIDEAAVSEQASDKKRLLDLITKAGDKELWLVLIGHGTFDGKVSKFNLRGEDITANELEQALSIGKGTQVIVNCFSCSGAFLPVLSRPGRIVITATKSGAEMNYSRFGDFMSLSILDPAADLDHDHSVSILEAFLMAAKRTEQFYMDESRLSTEHPLLEDGGDKKGVSAAFFRGIRLVKQAAEGATIDGELAAMTLLNASKDDASLDGLRAEKRNELELALRTLRTKKASLPESEYYTKVGEIALELASLYDAPLQRSEAAEIRGQ